HWRCPSRERVRCLVSLGLLAVPGLAHRQRAELPTQPLPRRPRRLALAAGRSGGALRVRCLGLANPFEHECSPINRPTPQSDTATKLPFLLPLAAECLSQPGFSLNARIRG